MVSMMPRPQADIGIAMGWNRCCHTIFTHFAERRPYGNSQSKGTEPKTTP
jgi:hypothetical protein